MWVNTGVLMKEIKKLNNLLNYFLPGSSFMYIFLCIRNPDRYFNSMLVVSLAFSFIIHFRLSHLIDKYEEPEEKDLV